MKEMSLVSLVNILLSSVDNSENNTVRAATQDDIERYFG